MKNREIKFRAWDVEDKQWYYFVLHSSKKDMEKADHINFAGTIYHYLYTVRLDYKSWGQFTGLKDRKGKEIYEGDILKTKVYPLKSFEVYWREECASFSMIDRKDGHIELFKFSNVSLKNIEIIGNIFEGALPKYKNPELLNKKKI